MTRNATILAADTETTGTNARQDRIIQLAILLLDEELNTVKTYEAMYDPRQKVSEGAQDVHGYTREDLRDYPPFRDDADMIQELVDECEIFIAYSAPFDLSFLHHELQRCGQRGIPDNVDIVDPLRIFREHLPHTLESAHRYYTGEEMTNAHDALADIEATIRVLDAQLDGDAWPTTLGNAQHPPNQRFVDWSGKFVEEDGVVKLNFGKHRGDPALEHPSYLFWLIGPSTDFNENTKNVARNLLNQWRES